MIMDGYRIEIVASLKSQLLEMCDSQNKRAGHPNTGNIQPF